MNWPPIVSKYPFDTFKLKHQMKYGKIRLQIRCNMLCFGTVYTFSHFIYSLILKKLNIQLGNG